MTKQVKALIGSMLIVYSLYVYFVLEKLNNWSNVLSPILLGVTLYILFKNVTEKQINPIDKRLWYFLMLGVLAWFAVDVLWVLGYLLNGQGEDVTRIIIMMYSAINFFFLCAIFSYTLASFKKWNKAQVTVDAVIITLSVGILLWQGLFSDASSIGALLIKRDFFLIGLLLVDIIMCTLMAIWYFSIRKGIIPGSIRLVMTAISMFVFVDMAWIYMDFNGVYHPTGMIDALYIFPFVLLAIAGSVRMTIEKKQMNRQEIWSNIGMDNKIYLILLAPILLIIVQKFSFFTTLNYFILLLIYKSATAYIQYTAKNEELLKKEIELNSKLEENINQRTKELKDKNKLLEHLSKEDPITQTYNRRYFLLSLESAMKEEEKRGKLKQSIAVLFIDLDKFKAINDIYGHGIGDEVLYKIAQRLRRLSIPHATLARFGGDEFILYLKQENIEKRIKEITEKIMSAFKLPIEVGRYSLMQTASIGVAIYPRDARSVEALINNADVAMYYAKKKGRNRTMVYSETVSEKIRRMSEIEYFLSIADFDKEFELYYQPQFCVKSKKIIGVEALLRWKHEKLGNISPAEFIPIAEESDLIIDIGEWVSKKAVLQIIDWNQRYQTQLKMGINISPKQLDHKDFEENMDKLFEMSGLNPCWIDIEITENIAMANERRMFEIARKFKSYGLSISIDDFGTGYSSLTYLKQFPFNRIKIAKPLVDNITKNEKDFHIIKFIIQLSQALSIQTIAEGVETKEQLEVMRELECDEIQGYFLAKPMAAHEIEFKFLS